MKRDTRREARAGDRMRTRRARGGTRVGGFFSKGIEFGTLKSKIGTLL